MKCFHLESVRSLRSATLRRSAMVGFGLLATSAMMATVAAAGSPEQKPMPTTAQSIMEKTCRSYQGVQSVRLKAFMSVDAFHKGEPKAQRNVVVDIQAKAPDKFRADIQGDLLGRIVFDGEQVKVIDDKNKHYSQVDLAGDFQAFLELADRLSIPTPMLDFLVPQSCMEALQKTTYGEILPNLTLNGEPVHHLMFKNTEDRIHWQVWIDANDLKPMIKKVVITSAWYATQPQYQFQIAYSAINPEIEDSTFDVAIPAEYTKIKFLREVEKSRQDSSKE